MDILYNFPYRLIKELRDTRIQRLENEAKEMERKQKEEESNNIRNKIMIK